MRSCTWSANRSGGGVTSYPLIQASTHVPAVLSAATAVGRRRANRFSPDQSHDSRGNRLPKSVRTISDGIASFSFVARLRPGYCHTISLDRHAQHGLLVIVFILQRHCPAPPQPRIPPQSALSSPAPAQPQSAQPSSTPLPPRPAHHHSTPPNPSPAKPRSPAPATAPRPPSRAFGRVPTRRRRAATGDQWPRSRRGPCRRPRQRRRPRPRPVPAGTG